jgi:hypothetical protein
VKTANCAGTSLKLPRTPINQPNPNPNPTQPNTNTRKKNPDKKQPQPNPTQPIQTHENKNNPEKKTTPTKTHKLQSKHIQQALCLLEKKNSKSCISGKTFNSTSEDIAKILQVQT